MVTAVDVRSPAENPGGDLYLLTAGDYYRMVDAAIIPGDRRVYLWDGRLFEKMAKKQAHAIAQSKLARALFREVPSDRWYVSTENPVEIADDRVPLPDLAVIRGLPDQYPRRPPAAGDVALIVEIMDTSAAKDLHTNPRAYAAAKVPQHWVVNLRARRVEVYTEPTGQPAERGGARSYAKSEHFGPGQAVVLTLEGHDPIRIPVVDILPAEPPGG